MNAVGRRMRRAGRRHRHPSAGSDIETTVVDDPDGLVELWPVWDDLVRRSPDASPYLSQAWVEAWWRHFGRPRMLQAAVRCRPHVVVARRAGEVVAIIPWLRGSFRGFIAGLTHSGRLHRWTTYNGTRETHLAIDDDRVTWALNGPDGTLELEAVRVRGGLLHAIADREARSNYMRATKNPARRLDRVDIPTDLVEPRGLEPLTSTLPVLRSPS